MTKLTTRAMAAAMLALASIPASAGDGLDRTFNLINNSSGTIVAVLATNIDRNTFGSRDLLGERVLRPGQRINLEPVNIQGYCRFDIRIEFDDGGLQDIMDVNLCETIEVVTYGFNRTRNVFQHRITSL